MPLLLNFNQIIDKKKYIHAARTEETAQWFYKDLPRGA